MSRPHRHFLAACLAGSLVTPAAQATPRTFRIAEFSPDFYASVTVDESDLDEVFRPGSVSVFDARTHKPIITVEADELTFDLDHGVASANVAELPYGKQSLVFFEDFDFDGHPDLAIMDGQHSCYHGPSYRIFLRVKGKGFALSRAFTELAQAYCGMFEVDATLRRLATMGKSGCCIHEYNTYKVVNHVPYLLESVVEAVVLDAPAYVRTQRTGKAPSFSLSLPTDSPAKPILDFDLADAAHRHVAVFASEDTLDYALVVGPERRVEFSYYLNVAGGRRGNVPEKLPAFRFDRAKRELSFQNGAYRYVICDAPGRLGVEVRRQGRVSFLPGDPATRTGGLERLVEPLPANVTRTASAPPNPP